LIWDEIGGNEKIYVSLYQNLNQITCKIMRFRGVVAVILFSFLALSCDITKESVYEDYLDRLDSTLEMAPEYVRAKEQRISSIENMLHSRGVTPLQQYQIYHQLYNEYFAFQFDKAKDALDNQIAISEELDDRDMKNDAMLDKSLLLTNAGFFFEANKVFDALDTLALDKEQMVRWYYARQKYLRDYQEYVSTSDFILPDVEKIKYYQNKVLSDIDAPSQMNRQVRILRLLEEQDYKNAYEENRYFIGTLDPEGHDYAVQTYWQGVICDNLNLKEESIKWWVESAISDIKGAVKDNASLCSVAVQLVAPEDTERAFKYIRLSLDDAVYYNAKLRKVQIASTMPWIQSAYAESKDIQNRDRNRFLLLTLAAAVMLACVSLLSVSLYVQGRRAAREVRNQAEQLAEYNRSIVEAEDSLRRKNLDLIEANAAKEEYLGLFLSMCSGYLDKLKKNITRDQYEAELKNFYKTFDTSFLSLYPSFVEDLNSLLKPENRIVLKEGEQLNTELRIFALIKLGITQSSHIASLLRYSVNTIYNYRAQVKNAALEDRGNFEEMVKTIGSKH
jgi:hypothetical protein